MTTSTEIVSAALAGTCDCGDPECETRVTDCCEVARPECETERARDGEDEYGLIVCGRGFGCEPDAAYAALEREAREMDAWAASPQGQAEMLAWAREDEADLGF